MHPLIKPLTLVSLAGTVLLSAPTAMAELSGNIGLTSNYMWRGVTQSMNLSAISGGIDYSDAGFYAGLWSSNAVTTDYELDLYAGYSGELEGGSYDVGVISYRYPISQGYFSEAYLNGSMGMFDLGVAYTFGAKADTGAFISGDLYLSVGVNTTVGNGLGVNLTYGAYDFDDATQEDYGHIALTLSKDEFAVAIEQNDTAADDKPRVVASWSQGFEL